MIYNGPIEIMSNIVHGNGAEVKDGSVSVL